jgi:fermentation-respiration switch protein FrsA (DUF1100 family)
MKYAFLIFAVLLFLLALTLITAYVCFFRVFLAPKRKSDPDEIEIPVGEIYDVYREDMISWVKQVRAMPHKEYVITSFDGLKLYGRFFEHHKGAPIELMLHGYKGTSERDMSGGVLRAAALGRSAFIVDHRGSGKSEGKVITFGVKESRDCLAWIDFIINNVDKDAKIILTGISMGAATVMSLSDRELPCNVVGILADCGYSTTEAIIGKVVSDMKLPTKLLMPFIKLGARVFGGFKVDEVSPLKALKNSRLPVIFIHGDTDAYVPYEMSVLNYEACTSKKMLVTIEGAGHGLAFVKDPEKYYLALKEFFDPILNEKET